LRDFITKTNGTSFRIQGVLLDFTAFILNEWICFFLSVHIALFTVHIFLRQPFILTIERKKQTHIILSRKNGHKIYGFCDKKWIAYFKEFAISWQKLHKVEFGHLLCIRTLVKLLTL
jgi:hypothetical protein